MLALSGVLAEEAARGWFGQVLPGSLAEVQALDLSEPLRTERRVMKLLF
jgi:hypothetical protein